MGDVFHIEIHVGHPPAHRKPPSGPWMKLAIAVVAGTALVLAKVLPAVLTHEAPVERPAATSSHGAGQCEAIEDIALAR